MNNRYNLNKNLAQILKGWTHIFHIPGAEILAVLPGRSDMPLDIPLAAVFFDPFSDHIPGFRVSHPAV